MKDLKTYQLQNAQHEDSPFGIARMEDMYVKRKGATDDPHRHDYYTVLLVEKASGTHAIDFQDYDLGKHQIFFVAPGQVHQVIEKEQSHGFVMTFSSDFLIQNNISLEFISDLNLFQNYGQTPPLLPSDKQFEEISTYCEAMLKLFRSDQPMKLLSIGAYMKLLLIQCNNICTLNPDESSSSASNLILRQFKTLVDQHYREEHGTSFYAALLHISTDHLNRSVKANLGKTAKEYIQARITTEAKRLLCFSELNTKEIAYTLGFTEPGNFSAFFKKMEKLSPSHFKQSIATS